MYIILLNTYGEFDVFSYFLLEMQNMCNAVYQRK